MSTQQRQLLADGALGSHPDAHLLLFAHPAELFGSVPLRGVKPLARMP
jgi:hypothetical protein